MDVPAVISCSTQGTASRETSVVVGLSLVGGLFVCLFNEPWWVYFVLDTSTRVLRLVRGLWLLVYCSWFVCLFVCLFVSVQPLVGQCLSSTTVPRVLCLDRGLSVCVRLSLAVCLLALSLVVSISTFPQLYSGAVRCERSVFVGLLLLVGLHLALYVFVFHRLLQYRACQRSAFVGFCVGRLFTGTQLEGVI